MYFGSIVVNFLVFEFCGHLQFVDTCNFFTCKVKLAAWLFNWLRLFLFVCYQCCEMLDYLGVPYIQSAGEAEAMCAFLNKHQVSSQKRNICSLSILYHQV